MRASQELLAPSNLVSYNKDWTEIGTKIDRHIAANITATTGIPYTAIARFTPRRFPIAARMSSAAQRKTTRVEDCAYSLLGLFGINMPLVYGEGAATSQRWQERSSKSLTIEEYFFGKDFQIKTWNVRLSSRHFCQFVATIDSQSTSHEWSDGFCSYRCWTLDRMMPWNHRSAAFHWLFRLSSYQWHEAPFWYLRCARLW